MKKVGLLVTLLAVTISNSQSYAPAVGQTGTTAIISSSTSIVAWATGATITRGKQDISNGASSNASYGSSSDAIGAPSGSTLDVVSLGDGGNAIVTFETGIANGEGYDFVVFENSFSDTFLELAFVEISSDGTNYFRFPSHSQTQTTTQVGGFGSVDCTYINNLAGKYKVNYGTPFDISDVANNALLDKANITHVKIIDVVGSINATYARYDSYGNKINDPFTTPFASSGFDLDAVGVINQCAACKMVQANDVKAFDKGDVVEISLYPNPATDVLNINLNQEAAIVVYDFSGKIVKNLPTGNHTQINVSDLSSGIYIFEVVTSKERIIKKLTIK